MSVQKHILVVTSVYPLAVNTERHGSFVHETILHLQSARAKFTVFAPAFKGSRHQILEGVKVHRFRYFWKRFENLTHGEGAPNKIQNPLYLIVAACYILFGSWQLFFVCLRQKPDIIHTHWPFPHGLMAFPASKILGIPMVFTFHGAELLLARKFGFVATILGWLLPKAKGVTANSSFTKNLISKLYKGNVAVIPYGLTIEAKPPKLRDLHEVPTLLFAGRLIERKGLRYLLHALPIILAKHPVKLRVAGGGVQEPEMRSLCQTLEIENAVEFLGFVDKEQLPYEYAACDIFVLPSIVDDKGDTETLGIVTIEALAHAKPVVACPVGGVVDVINSDTGFLVPEKDSQALAEAIIHLLLHPYAAAQMGQKGLLDVQARFGWSRIVPLWQRVFSQALGSKPSLNSLPAVTER